MVIKQERILVISPFENWPLSQGTIVRTHHLVKHLAQRNQVWFAHRYTPRFAQDGLPVSSRVTNSPYPFLQLLNPIFLLQLWQLARREHIDRIVISQFWSGIHGWLLHLLTGKRLLVDTHNLEYLRLRRMGHWAWPLVWLCEFIVYRFAQELFCVSETDRGYLERRLRVPAAKIRVVPNGADVRATDARQVNTAVVKKQLGLSATDPFVLFFGSLKHEPNAQAATVIIDELIPRLQQAGITTPVVLTGPGHERYLQTRPAPPAQARFAGFVDDITAVIKSANMVIVPLTSGSGTRFKIIESVACGKPVISTTVGAEGLEHAALGPFLTICDDWDAFAAAVGTAQSACWDHPIPDAFAALYDWTAVFAGV